MSAAAYLAAAATAMPGAGGAVVDIPGRSFTPRDVSVLVGESVTWRNGDHAAHTVVADDDAFASGRLSHGDAFTATFGEPGEHRYVCTIHRSMTGVVRVAAVGLDGPERPVRAGGHAVLHVRAPAAGDQVELERLGGRAGAASVEHAVAGDGGLAAFHVHAHEPARYRARVGDLRSRVVAVQVAPRVEATVRRAGRRVIVHARVQPVPPGATLALKRYKRIRFAYLPVRTGRPDARGTARFVLRTDRRTALRVGVSGARGGWAPADSRLLVAPRRGR